MARMIVADRDYVKGKYNLHMLKEIEDLVADKVEVNVPFNNYITGFSAFTHKAGIHAKAILANPSTYEIIDPADVSRPLSNVIGIELMYMIVWYETICSLCFTSDWVERNQISSRTARTRNVR